MDTPIIPIEIKEDIKVEDELEPFTVIKNNLIMESILDIKENNSKELKALKELIFNLMEKIDILTENQKRVNIPAPIIKLVVPENGKSVIKTIERDEQGLIKSIKEEINENLENRLIEGTIEIENKLDYNLVNTNEKKSVTKPKTKKTTNRGKNKK